MSVGECDLDLSLGIPITPAQVVKAVLWKPMVDSVLVTVTANVSENFVMIVFVGTFDASSPRTDRQQCFDSPRAVAG